MSFLLVFVCTVAGVVVLRRPLKRFPAAFYALAALLNVLYMANAFVDFPDAVRRAAFLLMQKCTLSLALFAVVMFIGAFRKDSKVGALLRPVRAELSIVACILTVGHLIVYLVPLAPRVGGGALDARFAMFFATVVLLVVLLVVLGVTSFEHVKRRMSARSWVRVQKGAYLFFGLVYVHVLSILLPAAMDGGRAAQEAVAIYTVLFASYAAARLGRAWADRRARAIGEMRCASVSAADR